VEPIARAALGVRAAAVRERHRVRRSSSSREALMSMKMRAARPGKKSLG